MKVIGSTLQLRTPTGHYRTVSGAGSWVVTFTSPTPIDVNEGPPGSGPIYVTHFSVALNAVTGEFVTGFFTR